MFPANKFGYWYMDIQKYLLKVYILLIASYFLRCLEFYIFILSIVVNNLQACSCMIILNISNWICKSLKIQDFKYGLKSLNFK